MGLAITARRVSTANGPCGIQREWLASLQPHVTQGQVSDRSIFAIMSVIEILRRRGWLTFAATVAFDRGLPRLATPSTDFVRLNSRRADSPTVKTPSSGQLVDMAKDDVAQQDAISSHVARTGSAWVEPPGGASSGGHCCGFRGAPAGHQFRVGGLARRRAGTEGPISPAPDSISGRLRVNNQYAAHVDSRLRGALHEVAPRSLRRGR